jgi:hypothetical protein
MSEKCKVQSRRKNKKGRGICHESKNSRNQRNMTQLESNSKETLREVVVRPIDTGSW